MTDEQIAAVAEALRVAYLRGTGDPKREHMTETIHELRDFMIRNLEER